MNPSDGIAVLAASIPAPAIDYGLVAPILIVFAAAVAGVLVEAFVPASARYSTHVVLSTVAIVAAFVVVLTLAGTRATTLSGAVVIDGPALFVQGAILIVALLSVALVAERTTEPARVEADSRAAVGAQLDAFVPQASAIPGTAAERHAAAAGVTRTEVFPLVLFAVGGMLVFPASNDLLTMFVALEVLSLPLYLLCGLARRRRLLSQEAALKYFLLGAFSSAFFLYGVAMLYGYAGTVRLRGIADAIDAGAGNETTALIGVGLLAVGLLFKIGAVPFHSWTPDVYQGAPTPVTAFMAAATKIAAFGALLRVLYVAVPGAADQWRPILWAVAIATMLVGAVLAVTQNDIKRMLAYSAISHTGFVLTGVVAGTASGVSSTLFYLLVYGIGTVGVFAVVTLVRDHDGEAWELTRWAGLGRRSPVLGTAFALFLLSLAGIPLTSGFIAKFAVFGAAISGGAAPLVIVGVLASAVAAYFYVRVIVLMFFTEPPSGAPRVVTSAVATGAVVAFAAVITVVLGILPQPVLDLTDGASLFVW
ncbi:NADH-quinone oxidoreductase subunit NuoN [Rhodococcus sp. CH91]|uniref:NADH-quinone oxidoreductase subunit NuoN n=1 Tax=Rhodococcus sp. CH91 TaxID=2910256 RepID=UPI001F4ABF57|nr:NADH-quinone oxidoreductase subunit NuoN [Rhodococcus sp. CH91]